MKTIEGKKIFFEQMGYFEGNLFCFPFHFCIACSFLMEIIFFFQTEAPSCAVRASCLPNLERAAGGAGLRRRGDGLPAGSLGAGAGGGRPNRAGPWPLPGPSSQ